MTTNVNRHLNLRATRNAFDYSTIFTTSGFKRQREAETWYSPEFQVDIDPFHSGFRASPGLLAVNNRR